MELAGTIKMYKKNGKINTSGFTLIELMMAMTIAIIIMASIYIAYRSQSRIYTAQESVAELQQNIRAALGLLTRDIRMAGFDPTDSDIAAIVDNETFSDGAAPTTTETVNSDASQLAFTADLDGDGAIDQVAQDSNGDGVIDMSDMEQIAYRLNGTNLQRYTTLNAGYVPASLADPDSSEWQTVAEQIENIEFNYLDKGGNPTTFDKAKSIQLTLLAVANRPDPDYTNNMTYTTPAGADWSPGGDNFRRRFFTITVVCRNIGLAE